jgi:hypothetical protein
MSDKKCMKMTFPTIEQARKAARESRKRRGGTERKLRAYQCGRCQKFHLTSQSKKIGRIVQRKVARRRAAS